MRRKQESEEPRSMPRESCLFGATAAYFSGEERRRHQEQHDGVSRQKYKLLDGPHIQVLPPIHAPPDRQDVSKDVYGPEQLDPIEAIVMAAVCRAADAGEH